MLSCLFTGMRAKRLTLFSIDIEASGKIGTGSMG